MIVDGAAARRRNPDRRGGWLPDFPDLRDFTLATARVAELLGPLGLDGNDGGDQLRAGVRPSRVDLRPWFPPVEHQGPLNSCTSHAANALVEYFQHRSAGQHLDMSRLFLYKVTRNLLGVRGDTGAYLRTTLNALKVFGVPPEKYWPYIAARYDVEPPAYCYGLAANYQTLVYYRLDKSGESPEQLLRRVQAHLAAGLPAAFGTPTFVSILLPQLNGGIPFPARGDDFYITHAIAAVGYDDDLEVVSPIPQGPRTRGALLIRNSWGPGWGEGGYGWLPYEYMLRGLASDFWVIFRQEWGRSLTAA